MRLLRQLGIILLISFIGEACSRLLHIPIPGNILGMLLLLFCLCTGIIKLDMIDKISNFFLDNLAFFFIPAGVELLSSVGVMKGHWIDLLLICIISTTVVIVVTGTVVQKLKGADENARAN